MNTALIVNPPAKLHVARDMAGSYGVETGPGVVLPPLDLIYHAQVLREQHEIHFFDLQARPRRTASFFNALAEHQSSIVLVLVTVFTADDDLEFIRRIKDAAPDSVVFAKLPSGEHQVETSIRILKSGLVKRLLVGETELVINEIVHEKTTDGCAYINGKGVQFGKSLVVEDMDHLPDLDLSFVDSSPYWFGLLPYGPGNTFSFQSSRGCPYKCGYYCPYPLAQGVKFRGMSADKVYRNVKTLYEDFNITNILFRDATFTLNKKRIMDFCQHVRDDGMRLAWWCESRANCLDEDLLKQMALAGCRGLNVGVETGDEELLKSAAKPGGVDLEVLARTKRLADKYGLWLHFLMMVGLPDETKDSIYHTYQMLSRMKPKSMSMTAVSPYPGTELYKEAIENNWIVSPDKGEHVPDVTKAAMRGRYLTAKQVARGRRLLTTSYRLQQRPDLRSAAQAAAMSVYFSAWRRFDLDWLPWPSASRAH